MAAQHLEQALDKFGCLFAFHGQLQSSFGPFATIAALFVSAATAHPASHLYTTLHYYQISLQERPEMKKKMVATVMGWSSSNTRSLIPYYPYVCIC